MPVWERAESGMRLCTGWIDCQGIPESCNRRENSIFETILVDGVARRMRWTELVVAMSLEVAAVAMAYLVLTV